MYTHIYTHVLTSEGVVSSDSQPLYKWPLRRSVGQNKTRFYKGPPGPGSGTDDVKWTKQHTLSQCF